MSKTTASGVIAAIASFLMIIALAPPELQNQIPQAFPEAYRGNVAMILALISAMARIYGARHTADSPPGPKEGE